MKYSILAIMLVVAGCAHQSPQTLLQQPHVTKVAPVAKSAPIVATTPNAIVKKRWYSHFPHHPKWFHH